MAEEAEAERRGGHDKATVAAVGALERRRAARVAEEGGAGCRCAGCGGAGGAGAGCGWPSYGYVGRLAREPLKVSLERFNVFDRARLVEVYFDCDL